MSLVYIRATHSGANDTWKESSNHLQIIQNYLHDWFVSKSMVDCRSFSKTVELFDDECPVIKLLSMAVPLQYSLEPCVKHCDELSSLVRLTKHRALLFHSGREPEEVYSDSVSSGPYKTMQWMEILLLFREKCFTCRKLSVRAKYQDMRSITYVKKSKLWT